MPIASCGPASSGVISAGPQGAEPSKTLPAIHCEVRPWRSRAERSFSERVAGDVVEGVLDRDLFGPASDHDGDLGFVVDLGAGRRAG